jgi:leucine-zipper-like transcriptional regulator 1
MKWVRIESDNSTTSKVKNHTAVLHNKLVYIYAGFDGTKHKNTLNTYYTATQGLSSLSTYGALPYGRNGHTATLYNSDMIVIGGWNSAYPNTTKEISVLHLDTLTWERVTPGGDPMVACNMHTSNLYKDKIFVFRGGDGTNYLNDLYCYDLIKNTWNYIKGKGAPPSQRANHAATIYKDSLFIFGGWNGIDRLNDLTSFCLTSYEWSRLSASGCLPGPRAGMSLNSVKEGLLMFGGSGVSSTCYNDLHLYNVDQNCWGELKVTGDVPTPRAGHSLTSLSKREFLLMGGSNGNQYNHSYYVLDIHPPPLDVPAFQPIKLSFRDMCNNLQYSDIQFIIEGKLIYAHKVIITRLSEHFNSMFASGMKESRETVIEFKDIRYCVFIIILKYFYTGEIEIGAGTEGQEVNVEFIIDVLNTADMLLIDPVRLYCERMLIDKVDSSNVFYIQSACENSRANYLKEYCGWFVEYEV